MPEATKLEAFDLPTKLLRVATSAKHFSLLKISIDMSNNQSILSLFLHVTIFVFEVEKKAIQNTAKIHPHLQNPFLGCDEAPNNARTM